jgi:chemotaxis protein MotB
MLTFGDMMSLLLCFFIAIVSFSSIEIDRYRAALGSFRGALQSPFSTAKTPSGGSMTAYGDETYDAKEVIEAATEINRLVKGLPSKEGIELETQPEGVKITLSNPVIFAEGTNEMKSAAVSLLGSIASIIKKHDPIEVLIEGHTDDTPIHTARFPSNWELSAARAIAVLELFQQQGIPPQKLVAIGYGEYRPRVDVAKNASSVEKGVNRRVEIMLHLNSKGSTRTSIPGGTLPDEERTRIGDEQQ